VAKPDGNTVQRLVGIVGELPQANWAAFAVGALARAVLFLLPLLSRRIPAGLVVLFGSIALSAGLDLAGTHGVAVVGVLPQGLPSVAVPDIPIDDYLAMVVPAIGVLLVAFSESLGVAHEFAEKHGYEVDADQELDAHAVVNLGSALFGGMIAAGSMSASAVKEGAGARSQVANLVTWVATIVTRCGGRGPRRPATGCEVRVAAARRRLAGAGSPRERRECAVGMGMQSGPTATCGPREERPRSLRQESTRRRTLPGTPAIRTQGS
jgi:MFS superfamily sulfate permease-like transporter